MADQSGDREKRPGGIRMPPGLGDPPSEFHVAASAKPTGGKWVITGHPPTVHLSRVYEVAASAAATEVMAREILELEPQIKKLTRTEINVLLEHESGLGQELGAVHVRDTTARGLLRHEKERRDRWLKIWGAVGLAVLGAVVSLLVKALQG